MDIFQKFIYYIKDNFYYNPCEIHKTLTDQLHCLRRQSPPSQLGSKAINEEMKLPYKSMQVFSNLLSELKQNIIKNEEITPIEKRDYKLIIFSEWVGDGTGILLSDREMKELYLEFIDNAIYISKWYNNNLSKISEGGGVGYRVLTLRQYIHVVQVVVITLIHNR